MLELTNTDQDYIYFGEYSQKNRSKTSGHSYSHRQSNRTEVTCRISRSLGTSCSTNDYFAKMHEVAVTEIDDYFDYGFWKGRDSCSSDHRAFNTPSLWEELEDVLEETAVKITKEYNRYDGNCKVHYDVPVIGHMQYRNSLMMSKRSKIQQNWVFWNGKYYNPQFIYQYIPFSSYRAAGLQQNYPNYNWKNCLSGSLKQICPRMMGGRDPQMILGKVDEKHNRIAAYTLTKKMGDVMQIDLRRVCELTHIGTLGGYPRKLRHFPFDEYEEGYSHIVYYSNGKVGKKRKRRSQLSIIENESELCWVTRYKLEYRDITTGKWIQYENSFAGNQDICTEKIHKISLVARYIRITPLDFQNAKRMRVMVYGEGFRSEIKKEELEIETIRYTVVPPTSKYILDGYRIRGCSCCYGRSDLNKNIQKQKLIQDEVNSYYDSLADID